MRWDDQAQFHPVKYVKGLAATLPGEGCHVFEQSRVSGWAPDRISTIAGNVRARHILMATHLPLGQTGLFYAEDYPHRHAVTMGRAEAKRVPDRMYRNVETPHHSCRGLRDDQGLDWTGLDDFHGAVLQARSC